MNKAPQGMRFQLGYSGKILRGRSQFRTVYVKNLTEDFDDNQLRLLFESFGKIRSAHVMVYQNGKSKRFGFVSFADTRAAKESVAQLNGKKEMPNGKMLYVARAQKRSEREEHLKRKALLPAFDQLFPKFERVTEGQFITDIDAHIMDCNKKAEE